MLGWISLTHKEKKEFFHLFKEDTIENLKDEWVATADAFSGIRFRKPNSTFISEAPVATGASADAEGVPPINQPSDNRPDLLSGPVPIPADWLATVERRICESINPYDVEYVNDGRWLTSNIAMQAVRFFQSTSDVLPGEPYIYSSMQGDLVAGSGPRTAVLRAS